MGILYGTDLDTLSPTFGALTDDAAILRQWVALMLRTKLGISWSAPEIGADLQGMVLQGLTVDRLASIPSEVQAALVDQRIASVEVIAKQTFTAVGAVALSLSITVTPKDASVAPFSESEIASAELAAEVTRGL